MVDISFQLEVQEIPGHTDVSHAWFTFTLLWAPLLVLCAVMNLYVYWYNLKILSLQTL